MNKEEIKDYVESKGYRYKDLGNMGQGDIIQVLRRDDDKNIAFLLDAVTKDKLDEWLERLDGK